MSWVKDTFFGGAEKKAARAQQEHLKEAQAITKEGIAEARGDINRLFPEAQLAAKQGFQGAMDVFGQALPQQANLFQQGNVGAQQALMAGLPQQMNAILGGQVDLSGLQPVQLQQPDFSFAQQNIMPPPEPIGPQQEQIPGIPQGMDLNTILRDLNQFNGQMGRNQFMDTGFFPRNFRGFR